MADETDSISYLMALRRGAGPAAGAAPAREGGAHPGQPAPAQSPNPQTSYEGPEKRRSPRYKCEGSAEMCEVSCDVRTWATFTDISLHGCYVEAQATYPMGAVLRLKLEANGQRVEATGNVRVTYPYLGMGIAFVEMTPENETRLKDLLASISRPSVIMGPGVASSLPARLLDSVPTIANPGAALQALLDFFEDKQMLMREDFLRILRQSQAPHGKP